MAASPEKAKLDRATLEKHGIFYLDQSVVCSDRISSKTSDGKPNEPLNRAREYLAISSRKTELPVSDWYFPKHVDWVRELLLDCNSLIPSYAKSQLRDEELIDVPEHAIFHDEEHDSLSSDERKYEVERFRKIIKGARDVARDACDNVTSRISEHDWQLFMQHNVFKRYRDGRRSPFDL